jgi:SAM-dependent methyltransferase
MLTLLKRLFSSLIPVATTTEHSRKSELRESDEYNVNSDEEGTGREHPNDAGAQGNHQRPDRVTITELSGHGVSDKLVPFDENLLEKARTRWQFGDWETLAGITREELLHQPDRARLALLAASGHHQLGHLEETRRMVRLADEWGCDRMLIKRALVSGVHNTLGCVSALAGKSSRAERHFESALQIGLPGSETRLLAPARTRHQLDSLGHSMTSIDISEKPLSPSDRFDPKNYFLKPGYEARTKYVHYNDMNQEDKWQLEVYLYAYREMKKNKYSRILDIGCGSGYKLIEYLGDFHTVGSEVSQNVSILKERYPDRDWRESNFDCDDNWDTDLVVCSDVIEHLEDPDQLLFFLLGISAKKIILSTPDRDLCRGMNDNGPPKNRAHLREWNMDEFRIYVGQWFYIENHLITNYNQGTQMIVCRKRSNFDET